MMCGQTAAEPAHRLRPLQRRACPRGLVATLLLAVVTVGAMVRGRRDIALLTGSALAFLIANAAVCGILSNPHDRYQSRIIWWRWRRCSSPPCGSGTTGAAADAPHVPLYRLSGISTTLARKPSQRQLNRRDQSREAEDELAHGWAPKTSPQSPPVPIGHRPRIWKPRAEHAEHQRGPQHALQTEGVQHPLQILRRRQEAEQRPIAPATTPKEMACTPISTVMAATRKVWMSSRRCG